MANQQLTTNAVTFMDFTDERKLEVHISSNLPTTQIFDTNTNTYSPDWSKQATNLVLNASVYLDSQDVTDDATTGIEWWLQKGSGIEEKIDFGDTLIIDANIMDDSVSILTYICKVTYADNGADSPTAQSKITFVRVKTGTNGRDGIDGADAPAVMAQYSVDGATNWTTVLNAAIHKYVKYSYDGGATYTTAIKIVGEDGRSVSIRGTAYTPDNLTVGEAVRLYADSNNTTIINTANLSTGDSYLVSGYLCVYNEDNGEFICTGTIQGPAGHDGQSSYVFIRYATDANGSNISTNPSGKTYIGVHTSNTNIPPTNPSVYTWSKFIGDSAKSIILNGSSQVFKVSKSNVYTPLTIAVTAQTLNASITSWEYSFNGGITWTSTPPNDGSITRNGNVVTITGSKLASNSVVIKAADSTHSDTYTVYKAFDGEDGSQGASGQSASMAFLTNENVTLSADANGNIATTSFSTNVVAYNGATKVTPTIGTISGLPTGMTFTTGTVVNNEIPLVFTITNNATVGYTATNNGSITIPVNGPVYTNLILTWSKVNSGAKGEKGEKGSDAYTVILTNESHVFAGDVSNAVAGSATTQVLAYSGTSAQNITISSINGKTAAIIDTDTGIAGLKFKCSALSGTSPTITFTCTNAFASPSGTIPIVLSVGGVQITKLFTYSIAFKGATGGTGGTGPAGAPATAYWLVSSASAVQKTSTGTVATIPSTLTFTGKSKTGTGAPQNYACRWIIAYSTDGSTYTNAYTSASDEASRTFTVATTYKAVRVRMYMAGGTTYLLDEQIIPVISDGMVDLDIGGRNLILASNVPYNNSEYRVASYNMSEDWELNTTYTLTLKGTIEEGKIFGAWANGSGTRVATLAYDASKGIYLSTFKTPATIANQTPKVINIYNTPSTTAGSASIEWIKLEKGNKATDWSPAPEDLKSTTFQLYAPKGYLLTNDVPAITLEAFAYDGSQQITNATFAWYSWNGETWVVIGGAAGTTLAIDKSSVFKSSIYKCDMTYGGKVYTATATVEDKTDIYDSLIHVTSKYSPSNRLYWVLYSTVYSDEGEKDKLLGPVSVTAPTSPTTGAYWYKIDETNYTVTLMKYSGAAWVATSDKQEFVYDWFILNDTNSIVTLGERSKVKIVTADNFSRTCSVQCNVLDQELAALTHSNQVLNDPSDPIVSAIEPINPINGQLWIKTGANGSYMLLVWDASNSKWVISEADSQKKVYVSKPTTYSAGDIWIVAAEYEPDSYIDGVLQTEVVDGATKVIKHLAGTMLRAQYGSDVYKDSDWVDALIYKKELDKLKENLDTYNQFFTFDNTGMTMKAKSLNGQISEFSTKLTNNELGFYQGENKVAYINNNQLNISKAEITNGMTIGGDTPILQIGNFAIIQESNGSLSIGLKS